MLAAVGQSEVIRTFNGVWRTIPSNWQDNGNLVGITRGNNRWLMCGDDGGIGYGDDIENLTIFKQNGDAPYSGDTNFIKPIHVTGSTFIIVGESYNRPTIEPVLISTDNCVTWNNASGYPASATDELDYIGDAWKDSGGLMVITGNEGMILTGTDGDNWTLRDPLAASNPGYGYAIIKDEVNNLWIAIANDGGTKKIYTATDPTATTPWTLRYTSPATTGFGQSHGAATLNGTTILHSGDDGGLYRTTDGINYSDTINQAGLDGDFKGGVADSGVLYTCFPGGTSDNYVRKTTDGSSFQDILNELNNDVKDMASDGVAIVYRSQELWTNNAETTLANPISNVASSFDVVNGDVFANPVGGDFQRITLEEVDAEGNTVGDLEIMYITGRVGNTLTVLRGSQILHGKPVEGNTQRSFPADAKVTARITAGMMQDLRDIVNGI